MSMTSLRSKPANVSTETCIDASHTDTEASEFQDWLLY